MATTDITVPYDLHVRFHPDGSLFASFQFRRIITIDGEVVSDKPLDSVPIDPTNPEHKKTLEGFLGEALTQSLAVTTTLNERLDQASAEIEQLISQHAGLQAKPNEVQSPEA